MRLRGFERLPVWQREEGRSVARNRVLPGPQELTSLRRQGSGRGRAGRGVAVAGLVALTLAGCSGDSQRAGDARLSRHKPTGMAYSQRVVADGVAIPKGGGVYKLGSPYQIAGRWYVPREEPGYDAVGIGSWYGADFHGRRTANGEIYDMQALTAAHPTLPLPSYAWVTNQANGRTLLVRINDRGPYSSERIIDLSRTAARELGYEAKGTARLRVRYAGPAPLNGDDHRERTVMANAPWRGGPMQAVAEAPPQAPRWGGQAPQQAYAYRPSPEAGQRVPYLPPEQVSDEQRSRSAYTPAVDAGAWSVSSYRQGLAGRRSLGGPQSASE